MNKNINAFVWITLYATMGVCIMVLTTGCSNQRGWQFNIGVTPVSSIENKQAFQADAEGRQLRKEADRY